LGWVSALDHEGRTIWIVDAHGYGKLTAFPELERTIHELEMGLIVKAGQRYALR